MVTIKDIARVAQVSVATVSRVTGNYGYVAPETRATILRVCDELHYKPNAIARSMVKKKTNTLGLVIADIHDPFYINIIDIVEKTANQNGYSLLFCNSNEDIEKEQASVRVLMERQVEGIILVPVNSHFDTAAPDKEPAPPQNAKAYRHIDDLIRNEIPFIFLDRYIQAIPADAIILDNEKIAYEATESLITQGRKNILVVANSTVQDRLSGVKRAFEDHHEPFDPKNILFCDNTVADGCRRVLEYLNNSPKPAALLALDNLMTLGSIKALNEKKLKIMEDIDVIGFDDIDLYEGLTSRNISTISQPIITMGEMATQRLIDKIEGRINNSEHEVIRFDGIIKYQENSKRK